MGLLGKISRGDGSIDFEYGLIGKLLWEKRKK